MPIIIASPVPTSTAPNPTATETREPYTMRLNISRPMLSVPIRCWSDEPCKRSSPLPVSYGYGAICSAKIAAMKSARTRNAPNVPSGFMRTNRAIARRAPPLLRARSTWVSGIAAGAVTRSAIELMLASTVSNLWIQPRVEDINQQVGKNDHRRKNEDDRLHDRIIAIVDRVEQIASHSWDDENAFEHDRAADHNGELQT